MPDKKTKNKKYKKDKNTTFFDSIALQIVREYKKDILPDIKKIESFLKKEMDLITLKTIIKHPSFGLAVAFLIWGASAPITKLALFEIGPASLLFLRMVVSSVILFPFALRQKYTFAVKDEVYVFLSAIFGVGVHIYLIYLALPSVSSVNVPVINALSPFLFVLLAWIFFREKVGKRKYFGMIFGFLGAFVITTLPVIFPDTKNVLGVYSPVKLAPSLGDLIILISVVFGTIGSILIKPIRHIPGHIITFWQSAVIAVAILPLAISEVPSDFVPTMSIYVIFAILFTAIANTVVAYTIYNESLHRVKASDVGLLSYLAPVSALLIAVPLLGEWPSIWFVMGTILVLYGVWIAERKVRKNRV